MDETRFDRWTRRRFALGTGGVAASLLGLRATRTAEARKRKKHKKRCRNAMQPCTSAGKKGRCCKDLQCEIFGLGPDRRCCKEVHASCTSPLECCGLTGCQEMNFVPGTYCCKLERDSCVGEGSDSDCCRGLQCINQSCIVQM